MKKYIMLIMSGVLMTSCIDTTILPVDKTTGEDYWKDKSQVQGMVNGAYKQMVSTDVMDRLIVWGGFRSDELDYNTDNGLSSNTTRNNLQKISYGNLEKDNPYCTWAALYNAINRCNIVLERAPGTVSIDPAYTEETYKTDKSQMLALRALCYFYLVRTFRDVPYSSEAFVNSSQTFEIPQTAPATVLANCIKDLEEAIQSPLSADSYDDWRRVGLINRDGIRAILADIYLWRASVMHNAEDYQKCIDYCDEIIASKKTLGNRTGGRFGQTSQTTESEYPLVDGEEAFYSIFVEGNSQESIFELQMDGNNDVSTSVRNFYFDYNGSNVKTGGFLQATNVFKKVGDKTSALSASTYVQDKDRRWYENLYSSTNGDDGTSFPVRKMVYNGMALKDLAREKKPESYGSLNRASAGDYSQNWIVYRLTDIMLMKAEALVQLAASDEDSKLTTAFNLVDAVNKRALSDTTATNRLAISSFNTKEKMEGLVLDERGRELCFEGKRWYDMLRYNFRHMTPTDYTKTYYDIYGGASTGFVSNSSEFITLLQRRYVENGAAICAKMQTEPYLYFPVPDADMKVNPQLHQNPAYATADKYERN